MLGPDNIQVPSGTAGGSDSSYTKSSTTSNNAVNKVTEHTTQSPGTLRRQSIAVVVDSKALGAVNITDLRDAVTAAAGIDVTRGDTLSVNQMPFDTSSAEAATAALEQAKEGAAAQRTSDLIRTGSIALAVLILAIVAFIVSRKRGKRGSQAIDLGEMQVVEPAATRELAWLDQAEPAALGATVPAQRAGDVAARRSELSEMVERQPDEVAELLRGWLADRRS